MPQFEVCTCCQTDSEVYVQRLTAENQLQSACAGTEPDVTTRLGVIKLHGKVTEALRRLVFHYLGRDKITHSSPAVADFIIRLDCSGIMCTFTELHRFHQ